MMWYIWFKCLHIYRTLITAWMCFLTFLYRSLYLWILGNINSRATHCVCKNAKRKKKKKKKNNNRILRYIKKTNSSLIKSIFIMLEYDFFLYLNFLGLLWFLQTQCVTLILKLPKTHTRLPITRMRNRYQYRFLWTIISETYLCKI